MDENKKKAEEKIGQWEPLFTRMQNDANTVNLVKMNDRLLDVNSREIPDSVYLLLSDPAEFAWRVESALGSAIEQVGVTSLNKRFDTLYLEDFIRVAFVEADKLLPDKDLYPLNPFLDQQGFRRGRMAVVPLFHLLGDELIPDITPWDTGYVVSWPQMSAYRVYRSKEQIETEYPEEKYKRGEPLPDSKEIEFLNIWTKLVNELWAGNVPVYSQKNPFGYNPVIYRKVPMGSMLLDKDTIEYQGESGLFLIRDLVPELNRLVSIIQSVNMKAIDRALQLKIPMANIVPGMKVEGHDEVTKPGQVNVVPSEGGYFDMPLAQLQEQAQLLHQMIQARIDRATASIFQSVLQPKSATEIIGATQERENIILPRLGTRGLIKQAASEMFIKQTISACERAKVSEFKLGNRTWELAKLKGEYSIEFKYHFRDPKLDIARTSMAAAQRGLIPDKSIRRDTLQREDSEGDERILRWEEAERLSPLIKLNRARRAVGEEADKGEPGAEEELMMLTLQMIPALKQAMEGMMTPPVAEEVKPTQPLVPLIGGRNE